MGSQNKDTCKARAKVARVIRAGGAFQRAFAAKHTRDPRERKKNDARPCWQASSSWYEERVNWSRRLPRGTVKLAERVVTGRAFGGGWTPARFRFVQGKPMQDTTEDRSLKPLIFGRYCLLERLNTGGMAEIFRARPFYATDPRRYLVIKRILPHLADDASFITMFVDEARITTQLSHPNICQLYELGLLGGSYYIIMEYIAGRDVLSIINWYRRQRSFLPPAQVGFIVANLCAGLDYAHAKKDARGEPLGIVHRDISPQNVLVGFDGAVKVIDFGIARASVRRQRTEVGVLKGKFGYMSPEQVRGEDIDHRSDIFATGILLWEMLTARRLFYSKNDFDIIERVREMVVPAPSTLNPAIAPELDAIVARALERDRDRRYQTAGEMESELRLWLDSVKPTYSRERLAAWMRAAYKTDIEEEAEREDAFQQFVRPRDVVLYLQRTGQPLPENIRRTVGETLSARDLSRLDTEMAAVPVEVLAANDYAPIATSIDEERTLVTSRPRRRRNAALAATVSGVMILGVLAFIISFAGGTSLGTKGRFAVIYVDVPDVPNAVLTIDGHPRDAREIVDGRWVVAQLNPGHHQLRVSADGYEPYEQGVFLQAGQKVDVDLAMEKVVPEVLDMTVQLPSDIAGMRLAIDGDEQELKESYSLPLRVGETAVFELAAPGYLPHRQTIARDMENTEIHLTLQPVRSTLILSSAPPGRVLVNGVDVGLSDPAITLDDLAPFQRTTIEVVPDVVGFQRYRLQFVFDGSFQRQIHAQLIRIGQPAGDVLGVGTIRFVGDDFYLVDIDDRPAGFATGTGVRTLDLTAGAHTVRLRRGVHESVFSVDVEPGRTHTVRVPLSAR